MLGIVTATEREFLSVLNSLENAKEISLIPKRIFKGTFFGIECVLIWSNVGKINASLSTQLLIDVYNCDKILNIGLCGGVDLNLIKGGVYAVDKVVEYDFDLTVFGNRLGENDEDKTQFYEINNEYLDKIKCVLKCKSLATADKFSEDEKEIELAKGLGADLRDMEGVAVLRVCKANNLPCLIVKGVSNGANSIAKKEYQNTADYALKKIEENLEIIAHCLK